MTNALKVLLIDDDEDDLMLARAALAEAPGQYEVETCTSLAGALVQAELDVHDVYLVDYRLGAESGVDFIRRATELGREGPFILLTGQGEEGTDTEALRAGASDYLVKRHLTPDLLGRSIRYAIERGHLQARLRDGRRLQTIGMLAAGIAHEYNNQLTAIIGSVDLARWSLDRDAKATARHLVTIETAARDAATLTQRLLSYAESAPLDPRPLEVRPLVDASVSVAHDLVGSPFPVEMRLRALDGLQGDFGLLTQAIGGVLANSHEADPDGTPTIDVSFEQLGPDDLKRFPDWHSVDPGTFLVVTVSNSGDAVAPDVLARAFEPFYSTKFLGRGLGLAAAAGTVRRHGGAMRIESRAGGGAVTTIAVRVDAEDPDAAAVEAA